MSDQNDTPAPSWHPLAEGGYKGLNWQAGKDVTLTKVQGRWTLTVDGRAYALPRKASFHHAERILAQLAADDIARGVGLLARDGYTRNLSPAKALELSRCVDPENARTEACKIVGLLRPVYRLNASACRRLELALAIRARGVAG